MAKKVCLAYSGGLDTSCILKYLLVSHKSIRDPSS
jgi:argininosuccinate synthase